MATKSESKATSNASFAASNSQTRVALIGIIVESQESVEMLNAILHDYGDIVLGRMGVPHRQRGLNVVSIVVDAPLQTINALSGKLGRLSGVTVKTSVAHL